MALGDLTDRQAVLDTLSEFDPIGQDKFLDKYGFGRATAYFIEYNGKVYDSKAIAGAAHGYQHGDPLKPGNFSGGNATVAHASESSASRSAGRHLPRDIGGTATPEKGSGSRSAKLRASGPISRARSFGTTASRIRGTPWSRRRNR
jgi:hypothetical protein